MCGIWGIFGSDTDVHEQIKSCFEIAHRGPDCFRFENVNHFQNCAFGFHRLAIVDDLNGMQPIRIVSMPHIWMIYNGEIYNYKELATKYSFDYLTKCDGEALIHLYNKGGIDFMCENLYGVFGFILFDAIKKKVYTGRDSFGVRPVFKTFNQETGMLGICSEAKGLINLKTKSTTGINKIEAVLPGTYQEFDLTGTENKCNFIKSVKFHKIGDKPKYDVEVNLTDDHFKNIRETLTNSVRKRLMAERRIGCLLSGGLDSSLICGLVVQETKKLGLQQTRPIQTFSIGIGHDSPDIIAARKVANELKTEHHEVIFTPQDAIDAMQPVIRALEVYDITTIRASIPMYLLAKYIKEKTDTTVLFSGEGADEIGQGYIYFYKSPSAHEGHEESLRLCNDLYMFDVCRADRTTAANGLELRVPFLDHFFTHAYFSIPEEQRRPTKSHREKYLIRQAFDSMNIIPNEILWRPKEAFSDGVASKKNSLWEILQVHIETLVSDDEFKTADVKYPFNTPKTKEAFYFRRTFEQFYPNCEHFTPYIWLPKWFGNHSDPSARTLNIYDEQQTE